MTTILTEHIQKSAQGTNVPNNHAEYIQDGAQNTYGEKLFQNTFKRVRKALTYQRKYTEHIQNSAQCTKVTTILTEHIQKRA